MLQSPYLKYAILLVLSLLLSSATVVFGAIPMRAIRKIYGRLPFWTGHIAGAAILFILGLTPFAFAVLVLTILIGSFSEVEEHGISLFGAAATSILGTLGLAVLAGSLWVQQNRIGFYSFLKSRVDGLVQQLASSNPDVNFSVDAVMYQLPSGLVVMMILALAIALIWEKRILFWFRLPKGKETICSQLMFFKVPDAFVWVSILTILGAMLKHGQPWIEALSLNMLNVLIVLYFLQGLAVVAMFFRVYKVSAFWQAFWYIVLIVQLFLLVGLVGFVDYWLEFRERLLRKSAATLK